METIVRFKIGRGGQFFNGGHKSYVGDGMTMQDYIANSNDLFIISGKLVDGSGNELLDEEDAVKDTGTISIDGEYDTIIFKSLEDIDDDELSLIIKAKDEVVLSAIAENYGHSKRGILLMKKFNRWNDLVDCFEPETYVEENYFFDYLSMEWEEV